MRSKYLWVFLGIPPLKCTRNFFPAALPSTASLLRRDRQVSPPFIPMNVRSPNVLLSGLWMVPSMGGMPKTIELFRRVLDAKVVSFTNGKMLDDEGSAVRGAEHIRTGLDFRGRFYSWAPKSARLAADKLASQAELISCHTLYRYHVHWVRHWVAKRNIPYWVVPHGCLDPYVFSYRAWQKKPWMWAIGRRHLREASAIIFSTRREKEKAAPYLSADNGRVIYWPVTNQAPGDDQRAAARSAWRNELGCGSSARLILFLGRLHSMKRPAETISAFLQAQAAHTHLVLAGPDGDLTSAQLRDHASGSPNVHLLGPIWGERKDSLLAAVDGFVSLSIRENFGHSAAEAMRSGVPVLLSPGNDLVGEIYQEDCGWMLPDETPDAAAQAFREFDRAPIEVLRERAAKGKAWAVRELGFDTFAARLQALAHETIERHKTQFKR